MSIAQNIIKVGIVSSVDGAGKRIKATFPDRDDQVSAWLPAVSLPGVTFNMPSVGDTVLCVFLGNGLEKGYWLGVVG